MQQLADTLKRQHISLRAFAREAEMPEATLRRMFKDGSLPPRYPVAQTEARMAAALEKFGVTTGLANEVGRNRANDSAPDETAANTATLEEEQLMLIPKQGLAPAARRYWGLDIDALGTPWKREEVFLGDDARVAYEHMLLKARHGGLLAVIGESGAGKTLLKDYLVSDLVDGGEVVVIEPHTQAMEGNDVAGKTLKTAHINEAILREIAPNKSVRRTMEGQLAQIAALLAASLEESRNRRHLLIIDEAHALPKPTLRHLKRFLELENPLRRGLHRPMLGVVLLGQPELAVRLSPYDQDVREVWQRCEVITLGPLVKDLEAYAKHRLGAAAAAFAPDAWVKLAGLMGVAGDHCRLYPLAIDNWLAATLNAWANRTKTITGEHVAETFTDVTGVARKGVA